MNDPVSMKTAPISGTENYAYEAPELLKRYESISFANAHAPVLQLIPPAPCRILDIGAGTGRDAVTGKARRWSSGNMNIEPLCLEGSKAASDGLEALADRVEMVHTLLEAEIGKVVGDQLVAEEGGELFLLL